MIKSFELDKDPFIITSAIGQELESANQPECAVKVLEAACSIGTESLNLEASLMETLGRVHWQLSNIDNALFYMEKDLEIHSMLGDDTGSCRARNSLGVAYFLLGRYDEAMKQHSEQLIIARRVYEKAVTIIAQSQDEQLEIFKSLIHLGNALRNLGHIHKATGKLSQAMQFYSDSLLMAQKLNDRNGEGIACADLGSCHIVMGNYSDAVDYFQQELDISQRTTNKSSEATALGHLGIAYLALNNLELALENIQKSLELAQDISDRTVEFRALNTLGYYYITNKEYTKALPHLQRAGRLAQEHKGHINESNVCLNLLGVVKTGSSQ